MTSRIRTLLHSSIILTGAVSLLVQSVYIREILGTFRGGEFTLGTVFFFWLIWTAIGSGIIGRYTSRMGDPAVRFFTILPWYGIFGYCGIMMTGTLSEIMNLTYGEVVPYDCQFLAISVLMMPFNVAGGMLFVTGVQALESARARFSGSVFTLEALGSGAAGLVFSLLLVPFFPNRVITYMILLAVLFATGAVSLTPVLKRCRIPYAVSIATAVIAIYFFENLYGGMVDNRHMLCIDDTPYGRLIVTRYNEQTTFYSDSSPLFSMPDRETAEYTVHLPMLATKNPRRVLIISGGPGGLIDEVLKYPDVAEVVSVEINPAINSLARKYLDEPWHDDPRVKVIEDDGRSYLNSTASMYDVIICKAPPPLSGVSNRFYTRDFFRTVRAHLRTGGVLGFSLTGAENYLPEELISYIGSIRLTLENTFSSVSMFPGITVYCLAGSPPGLLDNLDWRVLNRRRIERGIETAFVREYFLEYIFSEDRLMIFREDMAPTGNVPENTDTHPTGYLLRTIYEGTLDNSRLIGWLGAAANRRITGLALLLAGFIVAATGLVPGKKRRQRSIIVAVTTVGLTEIALEVIALFAYQSLFGTLYSRIALLTGAYMTGLAFGSWYSTKRVKASGASLESLVYIQGAVAALPVAWTGLFYWYTVSGVPSGLQEVVIYLLTILAGFAGGIQYPLADALYRQTVGIDAPDRGTVYALDLAGATFGALVTAVVVIPLFGMIPTLCFLASLNIAAVLSIRTA